MAGEVVGTPGRDFMRGYVKHFEVLSPSCAKCFACKRAFSKKLGWIIVRLKIVKIVIV